MNSRQLRALAKPYVVRDGRRFRLKDFDPKDAVKLANVPLHPGAEKAYREAGLLK